MSAVRQREQILPSESLLLPSSFMLASSRNAYYVPRHIMVMEQFVLAAIAKGDQMLTIEAPVRHGKSFYVDWHLPAWYLGTFPWKHVGIASHEQQFAAGWGAKSRDTLVEFGSSFGVTVTRDTRSRSWWEIEKHGGSMRSFGMKGGGITGRGFDLLILDDLIKNAADADSTVVRESQVEFLRGTAMSRLEPGATLIVMMARWHEDDLIGWIHREMPGQFQRLRMPAIAEPPSAEFPSDPTGRQPGEALWPARFPLDNLARRRERSGEYWFNALYQQRPSPALGSVFNRESWRRYDEAPAMDAMAWSWDMSFKDAEDSSYVVGQVWGVRGADFYVLHQVRGQWDYPTTKRSLVAQVTDPRWQQARASIFVEDKANGPAIIADLRHELGGLIAIQTGQDSKLARARSISGYVEAGNVYLPATGPDAEWVPAFIEEHAQFPKGAHDDQVDATSQAIRELLKRRGGDVAMPTGNLPPPRRA